MNTAGGRWEVVLGPYRRRGRTTRVKEFVVAKDEEGGGRV